MIIGILLLRPLKGRGVLNQGSTLPWLLRITAPGLSYYIGETLTITTYEL